MILENGKLIKHRLWRDVAIQPVDIQETAKEYRLSFYWYNTNVVRLGESRPLFLNLLDNMTIKKDDLKNWKTYNAEEDLQ